MKQIGNLNLRFIKIKGDRVEIAMINVIITEEMIKIGIDQIAETGEVSLVNKVEVDQDVNRIIGMIIGEEILEVMWEQTKSLEDRIEEDIKEIIGLKIIAEKEIGVGLEKDNFQGILIIEEKIEA